MSPRRVLVVEDNAELRELLQFHLEGCGYSVDLAADGAEGLSKAIAGRPDAIIADLIMPGLDGRELAERLHEREGFEDVPILVYSGIPRSDPRITALTHLPSVTYEIKGRISQLPLTLERMMSKASAQPSGAVLNTI